MVTVHQRNAMEAATSRIMAPRFEIARNRLSGRRQSASPDKQRQRKDAQHRAHRRRDSLVTKQADPLKYRANDWLRCSRFAREARGEASLLPAPPRGRCLQRRDNFQPFACRIFASGQSANRGLHVVLRCWRYSSLESRTSRRDARESTSEKMRPRFGNQIPPPIRAMVSSAPARRDRRLQKGG